MGAKLSGELFRMGKSINNVNMMDEDTKLAYNTNEKKPNRRGELSVL